MGGKLDQIRGRIKEAGALADDDGLKREGKLDQVAGKAKEKVKEAADKMKHTRSLPGLQEEVDVAARSSAQAPSEAALMRAVLEDALECFQMKFDIERPLAKRKAREAEEWFFNDDSSELFSFVSVCSVLGLGPECIRQRLMRLRPIAAGNITNRTSQIRR